MKILIVGGAGYVGSHAARYLVTAGHDVWVYDNLSRGNREAVPTGRLIEGDLHDRQLLADVLTQRRIEAVMHFAAFAYVGESVQKPAEYYENNFVGTFHLLEAMRQADVRRIVFSSTTATYGIPKQIPIRESEDQKPINPYGFTKLAVEQMLADYAEAYELGYAALRYFNAAGASRDATIGEDHRPETHLIPLVLQVALGQRSHLTIFGSDYPTPDGTAIRDYVHVEDLATAHLAALDRLEPGRGIQLNLGTGRGYSVQQVIETCRKVTGHSIPVQLGNRRPGDPPELVADAEEARRQLDWTPHFTSLESIVETAWNWHRAHPHGYQAAPNETRDNE